jgi:hypothetical protein
MRGMADDSPFGSDDMQQALLRRVEALEHENERLRQQLEPLVGPLPAYNPNFHPAEFMKALRRALLVLLLPIQVLAPAFILLMVFSPKLPPIRVGPLPLLDLNGMRTRHPGVGMGIVAVGGAAFGVVALGGLGIGVIAVGGGSIGLVAFGGGSLGVLAVGGGAVGFIAVGGGGAFGYYAMGQRARGKYVLAFNRQDSEAVDFFKRWVPGIQRAVTNPMPVLPIAHPTA